MTDSSVASPIVKSVGINTGQNLTMPNTMTLNNCDGPSSHSNTMLTALTDNLSNGTTTGNNLKIAQKCAQ